MLGSPPLLVKMNVLKSNANVVVAMSRGFIGFAGFGHHTRPGESA